ncbi:MAG: DUF4153 domain-containing protein [Clostridia bacterium]|nr:DUF4153 domain-containing protein [Clostridia bacterium]MBP3597817.1 DUF4153 domain-containing protein [Clostridia bacterium]
MKIKEKLKSIIQSVQKAVERFPVTIIVIFLYMAFLALIIDVDWFADEILEYVSYFTLYFSVGAFFTEVIFKNRKKTDIILYLLFLVAAICFIVIQEIDFGNSFFDIWWKFIVCYISTLIIVSVYCLARKSNKDFPEYMLKLVINWIKTSVVYWILAIGIAIISSIFIYLILDGDDYSLILRLEIILVGVYYFPKMLYSFVDMENEVNNFFKGLIKYVLNILLIIAFTIIYMYIVKILILRDMPKNQIFRILSALFVVGMPIWTMVSYFKDDSFLYKISVKLPLAFIPFIFLQIYTIGLRISANGLTPSRYMCVALIVFEIIYTLVYIFKKQKINELLIIFNVIVIISLLVPGINMFKMSDLSQSKILQMYNEKKEFTDQEKEKIYGAYEYLNDSESGKEYIKEIVSEDEIREIKKFHIIEKNNNSDYINIAYYGNINDIDIKGYSDLYFVNAYDYNVNKSVENCFSDLNIGNTQSNYCITLDLEEKISEYIEQYIEDSDEFRENFELNNELKFKDTKLVIEDFNLEYNTKTKKVKYYSIRGYVLEK